MMPRSIQGRMLLLSAVAILTALGIAGWAISGVLERVVTDGIDRRLDAEIALLASTIGRDGRVDHARLTERASALEAGRGWRWRIDGPDGAVGSDDVPGLHAAPHPGVAPLPERPPPPSGVASPPAVAPPPAVTPPMPPGDAGPIALEGNDHSGRNLHARRLSLTTDRGAVVLTAAAPRAVIARPLRDALTPLLLALVILGLLLAGATLVQLRLGLQPLSRLRAQLAAIRTGAATQVDEDQPVELRGLALELNALAADRATALATARMSAANLAHALKTPVATLALAVRDDPANAAQVARIDATIRHHLSRARAATQDMRASTRIAPAVADLAVAIGRLHAGRGVRVETDVKGDPYAAIDPQDFDELLGNLLDNAARHATATIRVTAAVRADDARRLDVIVADDGPGIPEADLRRVTQAGVRLDERGGGHGFGLAIVRELVDLHGGSLSLEPRDGGGLAAHVVLPARQSGL